MRPVVALDENDAHGGERDLAGKQAPAHRSRWRVILSCESPARRLLPFARRSPQPSGLRERKKPTQLYLGGELALAGLSESDLAGQRVLSGVDLGTPRAAWQLLYVTGRGAWHGGTRHGTADIGPRTGPRSTAGRCIKPQVGRVGLEPTADGL